MKQANRFNSISPGWNLAITIVLCLIAITCLAPVLLVIIISFSSSQSLSLRGYSFFPTSFTADAYKYLLKTGQQVVRGYRMTIVPICEHAAGEDPLDLMQRYFRLLQEDLECQPWNYLWTHKRWKKR